jgi:hypothetical protein
MKKLNDSARLSLAKNDHFRTDLFGDVQDVYTLNVYTSIHIDVPTRVSVS